MTAVQPAAVSGRCGRQLSASARLKEARERLLGPQTPDQHLGPHDNAELRAIEDECIREVIAMQERAGLQAATDGEFRRRSWWLDLIMGWEGFAADRTGHDRDDVAQPAGRDAGVRRACG